MADLTEDARTAPVPDLEWGLATGDAWAAPSTGSDRTVGGADRLPHYAPAALDWADDVTAVVGGRPDGRRATAGWRYLQPDGPDGWDRAALDRADRALDAALGAGLRPEVTPAHLELPGWLEERGGWACRETAARYAEFAAGLGRRFGDRVDRWVATPDLGGIVCDHVAGMRPPARGTGPAGAGALHHALLGAGLASRALRAAGVRGAVGAAAPLIGGYPATGDPFDRLAAERFESWTVRLCLDPVLLGRHMVPEDGGQQNPAARFARAGDLAAVAARPDFLSVHWHAPCWLAAPENLPRLLPASGGFGPLNEVDRLVARLGFALVPTDQTDPSSIGLPLMPEALADALARLGELYGTALPPVLVTDSGKGDHAATDPGSGAAVRRRRLLADRLFWLSGVAAGGVDVRGYSYWSVRDDAAWKLPYAQAYGWTAGAGAAAPPPGLWRAWTRSGAFAATAGSPGEPRDGPGGGGTVALLPRC
jgi:beta-glucosidase